MIKYRWMTKILPNNFFYNTLLGREVSNYRCPKLLTLQTGSCNNNVNVTICAQLTITTVGNEE